MDIEISDFWNMIASFLLLIFFYLFCLYYLTLLAGSVFFVYISVYTGTCLTTASSTSLPLRIQSEQQNNDSTFSLPYSPRNGRRQAQTAPPGHQGLARPHPEDNS